MEAMAFGIPVGADALIGPFHRLPSTTRPAAAKREAIQCDDHPDDLGTIRHGTAVSTSQKTQACPKASPNRSRHRYADPRRARRATAPERAQAPFSLPPGAAHSLFGQDQKENGGRIPRGNGPLREQNPPWPTSGGPSSPKAGGLLRSASPHPAPADSASIP